MGAWPALLPPCLLTLAACTAPASAPPKTRAAPIHFLEPEQSIAQLQRRMQTGVLDSRTLTRAYLDRIAQIDRAGPQLNAVIQLNPDAMSEAAVRDAERASGKTPGPLQGIPILLKDNIDATQAITTLHQAGAIVVDARIPTAGQWDDDELFVLKTEFKQGLARYLTHHGAPLTSLRQLIDFNRQHAREELDLFGQELFEQAAGMGRLDDPAYLHARARIKRLAGPEGIDAALAAQHLDALVSAATCQAWRTDPTFKDPFPGGGYSASAVAGYPSLTVPMGSSDGLPLGLLFMGPAWSEARLIALAYDYEQRAHARTPPQYLPSLTDSPAAQVQRQ